MCLYITPTLFITEVQTAFSTQFPFLKLEFFQNKPTGQPGVSIKKPVTDNRRIGGVQSPITDGDLEIKDDMKVQDLEKIFRDQFGLSMQVFRRSGNVWLETTMTNNWTLRKQNEHGREISAINAEKINLPEYDLNGSGQF
jgi:hypothetical protein